MAYYQSGPTRKGRSRQSDWMKNSTNNIVLDKCDYSGDATDEEQEDLPYDGDLERTYKHISDSDNLKDCTLIEKKSDNCLQLTYSEVSNHVKETNYKMQQVPQEKVFPYHPPATRANGIKIEMTRDALMLRKQAETQNHIDHLRFDYKRYPPAESPSSNFAIHSGGLQSGRIITPLPSPGAAGEIHCLNLNLLQKTTEGEKMSQMLKEQTEQLRAEVEDFYKCVTQAPSSQDRLVLKQLKGYLDALERKYVATREEHRGLQLQNYKHNPISVGEFDPDRKVEGEIFRLGMLLEDVQEKMDDNLCSQCPSSLIRLPTSPSVSACESVVSSCSVLPESELVSSISDPPGRKATEVNFLDNKKDESTKKSWATEVTLEKNCLLSLYNDSWDPFTQVQLRLRERDASAYEKDTQPLEEARLLANKNSSDVMQYFLTPEAENGVRGLELHRQPMLSYNHTTDQGKTESSLNFRQMKSPSKAKLLNAYNMEHNTVHLEVLQEQGNLVHPSNHCFHKIVENCPDECDNIIHPRLKTQVSNKASRIPCSYVKKRKNMENRKTDGRESVSRQHSAFIQEKAMDLDLSDTNLSFRCNTGSRDWFKCRSRKESIQSCATCRNKNISSPSSLQSRDWSTNICIHCQRNESTHESIKDTTEKKRIAAQSVSRNKQPDQSVCRLSEQQNLEVPKALYSRMYDTVILSPQYLAIRKSHSSNSVLGNRYNSDTKTKILNSTLDHAIQTANSLKKTTERMVQAVSEDLAKVKTHQNKCF
uniref:AKNA domain containing 1 n=1 Tax=Crocodylus porosus TaxID=8502 RepID=A0A7M4FLP2_CROPO